MSPAHLTAKGARTRARIVEAAAGLVHDQGVSATTVEDVRVAAGIGGSQLYHYFTDKEALVRAVADRHADLVVDASARADLGTVEGLWAWRDQILAHADAAHGAGGCPLGSLGSQIAETDDDARRRVAAGFHRWSNTLREGMRDLHAAGKLTADTDPDDLAATLLATLQGGLLLAQLSRDAAPLATALDTLLTLAIAE